MQKSEFENQLKSELEGFALQPADVVWQRVAVRIAKEKKRKRLIIIWFLMAAFLLGSSGWWLIINNENVVTDKVEPAEFIIKSSKRPSTIIVDTAVSMQKQSKALVQANEPATSDESREQNQEASQATQRNVNAGLLPRHYYQQHSSKKKGNIVYNTISKKQSSGTDTNHAVGKQFEQLLFAKNDPLQLDTPLQITTSLPDSAFAHSTVYGKDTFAVALLKNGDNAVLSQNAATKNKQWRLGYSFQAGVSSLVEKLQLFPSIKSSDLFAMPVNSSIGAGTRADTIKSVGYTYKFSWAFGAMFERKIAKRTNIGFGIRYQNLSTGLHVGQHIDSSRHFYDSLLQRSAKPAFYFRSGGSNSFVNHYHVLQFPVYISRQINKSVLQPIELNAGLQVGWLIASKALYYNATERVYYKEKAQLQKLQLGFQTGATLTAANLKKYSVRIGPHMHYQLTNFTKPVLQTNEHAFFIGVQTKIILK